MIKLYALYDSLIMQMKTAYLAHVDERAQNNLPPLALNAEQTQSVVENLINGNDEAFYLDLLTHRVPPGVDEAGCEPAARCTHRPRLRDSRCYATFRPRRR